MVGGIDSLKSSALQLFRFGIDSVLKIMTERIIESINQLIKDLMTKVFIEHPLYET